MEYPQYERNEMRLTRNINGCMKIFLHKLSSPLVHPCVHLFRYVPGAAIDEVIEHSGTGDSR